MPTGIDQSWGFADPAAAKKAGVQVVSMYLSWDQSKNITAADVKAYHGVGIGMLLNWESQAGAPLRAGPQGKADAVEAVRQAKALIASLPNHKPTGRITIYFSCDTDVDPTKFASIDAYYEAAGRVCHGAGFGVGCYGEASLVSHLAAHSLTDSEWQTYAWSGGVISPDADFYQYLNGQRLGGASVDFDRVIHPRQLGAWWPPTVTTPTAEPVVAKGFVMDAEAREAFAKVEKQIASLAGVLDIVKHRLYTVLEGDANHPGAGLRDIAPKVNRDLKVDKADLAADK